MKEIEQMLKKVNIGYYPKGIGGSMVYTQDMLRGQLARAIEWYVQKRLYESNELKNEQSVIKARIEFYQRYTDKIMNRKYCDERIAQLKKGLT